MSKLSPPPAGTAAGFGTSGVVGASGLAVFGHVGPNRDQLGRFFEDDPVGRAIREAIAKATEQGIKFGIQKVLDSPIEDLIKEAAATTGFLQGFLVTKAVQRYFRDVAFHEVQDELERQRRAEEAARVAREQQQRLLQGVRGAAEAAERQHRAALEAYRRFIRRGAGFGPRGLIARGRARVGLARLGATPEELDRIEAEEGFVGPTAGGPVPCV